MGEWLRRQIWKRKRLKFEASVAEVSLCTKTCLKAPVGRFGRRRHQSTEKGWEVEGRKKDGRWLRANLKIELWSFSGWGKSLHKDLPKGSDGKIWELFFVERLALIFGSLLWRVSRSTTTVPMVEGVRSRVWEVSRVRTTFIATPGKIEKCNGLATTKLFYHAFMAIYIEALKSKRTFLFIGKPCVSILFAKRWQRSKSAVLKIEKHHLHSNNNSLSNSGDMSLGFAFGSRLG